MDTIADDALIPAENSPRMTPVVRAVQRVMPCVVNIGTERIVRVSDPFDAFFNDFFGGHFQYFKKSIPLGSGVIVDSAGLVVTNWHVVKRASKIQVRLLDGKTYEGVLVAYDAPNDLALLKLEGDFDKAPLHAIEFALPDDLLLGETVVTVGNPFGLEHSVASGVLSAKNRSLRESGITFNDIIQTDAAINPGNSGGPLINLDGKLIGLNLAIRRDAEGIGFAIPMSRIESVLSGWLVPSRFSLAVCGFLPQTVLTKGQVGVIVGEVIPESPAVIAGLVKGDRILRINDQPVNRAVDVGRILWHLAPGDKILLEVPNKKIPRITIGTMSANLLVRRRLGLRLQELTPPLLKALGLPPKLRGLAISEVLPKSEFTTVKVRRGDIIIRVGEIETHSLDDALAALRNTRPGQTIDVVVLIEVRNNRGQAFMQPFRLNVNLK